MVEQVLCPVLVQRDEELAALEEALLDAHRGESRFAVLAGEAGMGKTRLASQLTRQAHKLGCVVLWGSCSEAELSLPYLPFVEAIGNYLDTQEIEEVATRLGATRRELSQLFPQLSDGQGAELGSDPAQAKLRLFEAIVALLASIEHTVVLVVEDVHWADESTRELLDHLARRLAGIRGLLLVTYRNDELHRRHPLLPVLQSWRRSRVAEIVTLEHLSSDAIAEMISAIFESDDVGRDFSEFMHDRSDGNPFVLEEMLREALERGDIFRTESGWDRKSIDELAIPATVRDAILLRLGRLAPGLVSVLEAGAVLGRSFDYSTLLAVSEADETTVQATLDAAVQQQLIEEHVEMPGRYRWRHALTQEAISSDTVTPRRQELHGRAADTLKGRESTKSIDLAHHLLGAGRFAEAIPVCLQSADDAERTVAFGEAISVLERVRPHVSNEERRAEIVCRIGRNYWLNGAAGIGEQYLDQGIATLEAIGEELEAARWRVIVGRCRWERSRPDLALADFERARDVLAQAGPSPDLATVYMRIAGLRLFELDGEGCVEAAQTAVEIAEATGADFERLWALSFQALGIVDSGDVEGGLALIASCVEEAVSKEYWLIASNTTFNEIWMRTHLMQGELEARLERLEAFPNVPLSVSAVELARSYVKRTLGDLGAARDDAERGASFFGNIGHEKTAWRCQVQLAEVLLEQGALDEAGAVLPPVSTRAELQDIVYDAAPRIRLSLARGGLEDAVARAEEILQHAETLSLYRETLALGVEAFVAAGDLDTAQELVNRGHAQLTEAGLAFLDEAQGLILLARDDPEGARAQLRQAAEEMERAGFALAALRARMHLAHAVARAGSLEDAAEEYRSVCVTADRFGARLIGDEARTKASSFGIATPAQEVVEELSEPAVMPLGERLVTSMFADVRGSTELTASTAPDELAERMAALYRFAKTEVTRHHGIVDKFAGDAVMATFNVSGARVDHCVDAVRAAFTLRDKAALTDLELGIGIAVGPAILAKGVSDDNIAVRGTATNLAARLQAAARGSEILLSEEAHRRAERWLAERGISSAREKLTLKGFDAPQVAYRISQPTACQAGQGWGAPAFGNVP